NWQFQPRKRKLEDEFGLDPADLEVPARRNQPAPDRGTLGYEERRLRNNQAVRRSRQRVRERQDWMREQIDQLQERNRSLESRLVYLNETIDSLRELIERQPTEENERRLVDIEQEFSAYQERHRLRLQQQQDQGQASRALSAASRRQVTAANTAESRAGVDGGGGGAGGSSRPDIPEPNQDALDLMLQEMLRENPQLELTGGGQPSRPAAPPPPPVDAADDASASLQQLRRRVA
uniref:BZIP domain-containing protein n=1 Tax=Macrostomum lignano TaxID=282301 RepID=A0A1I8GXP1_9PLAT